MAEDNTTNNTNIGKRRKTSSCPSNAAICPFSDLPDALLANVTIFLPKPSVALFAVALTAPSESWSQSYDDAADDGQRLKPSVASKLILSSSVTRPQVQRNNWEVLDFEEIDTTLAGKLSDDDLHAVLLCIGAGHNLKRLKLAGLVNISGVGLEPLRGSSVLQQIDLSLVGQHQRPKITPPPQISENEVFPVIESIFDAPDSSLRHLQLPQKWFADEYVRLRGGDLFYRSPISLNSTPLRPYPNSSPPILYPFIERYDHYLDRRQFACAGCYDFDEEDPCEGTDVNHWFELDLCRWDSYDSQRFTCYSCLRNFCGFHGHGGYAFGLFHCHNCSKNHCHQCLSKDECQGCARVSGCVEKCIAFKRCIGCGGRYCPACYRTCDCCDEAICKDCPHP